MILIAEGNYPGKMSCGWINLDKPVSLIGGYSPDFSARDVLKYRTMLRPTNAQNTTKPTHGTLTINTRKFGPNSNILIDGIIFDHTAANSYHPVKGKPAGFKDGMLTRSSIRVNLQDFPFRYLISEPIHAVNLFFIVLPFVCFSLFVFITLFFCASMPKKDRCHPRLL